MTAFDRVAVLVPLALLVGCGGEFQMAPVSGVVTLDGEPLANASLYFQPQRTGADPVVGPPSIGVTDEQGRYNLRAQSSDTGAVVGEHRVSISTFESRMVDPQNSDRVEIVSEERVPPRYRSPSELTYSVSRGGADDANFDLTSG
ncbi:hypothetical protein MalM25_22680 [Planctomycetes bacterium MalM25]|nr:hypothetical protein MalM25_22680 [Planctomycetes bacterium MalM25]